MKIDTNRIVKQLNENRKTYESLASSVDYELKKSISNKKIKTHTITHRIKTADSVLDKVRRKKIEKPFEDIHDLVGFRIVCLFLEDLEEIKKIVCEQFEVFETDDKINDTELNIFGYMSLHLKCRIKPLAAKSFDQTQIESDLCHNPEGKEYEIKVDKSTNENLKNIPFEIQIRTIAQDAWASISHYLDYKNTSVIPEQLQRDFHALSGLFYVADTHFSILKNGPKNYFFEQPSVPKSSFEK